VSRRVAGSAAHAVVESPCINVCKMEAGLCAGCFRSIDEIARWANIGDDEKRLILVAVAQRRGRADPACKARSDEAA
jgi:predicted Fe-S protein YdhL (DUF1289 family)